MKSTPNGVTLSSNQFVPGSSFLYRTIKKKAEMHFDALSRGPCELGQTRGAAAAVRCVIVQKKVM